MTFNDWGKAHAARFRIDERKEAVTLFAWCELLATAGFTPEELDEASKWIALNDPPAKYADHVPKLKLRVTMQRRNSGEAPAGFIGGTCGTCQGSGCVIVPLVKGMQTKGGARVLDDRWRTCVVRCTCQLGRAVQGGMLGLEAYEKLCPDWVGLWNAYAARIALRPVSPGQKTRESIRRVVEQACTRQREPGEDTE